jgi:hypothetical protein
MLACQVAPSLVVPSALPTALLLSMSLCTCTAAAALATQHAHAGKEQEHSALRLPGCRAV